MLQTREISGSVVKNAGKFGRKVVANSGRIWQIVTKAGKKMTKRGRKWGFWRPDFIKICQLRRSCQGLSVGQLELPLWLVIYAQGHAVSNPVSSFGFRGGAQTETNPTDPRHFTSIAVASGEWRVTRKGTNEAVASGQWLVASGVVRGERSTSIAFH